MSSRQDSVSLAEARRIALSAQLFGAATRALRRPEQVAAVVRQLGALQIDSVNVLVRSHYLPLFSRYGPYDRGLLDRAAYERRLLFEYWGHEASFLPMESFPLLRWRMARALAGEGIYGRLKRYASEHREQVQAVLAELRARGPLGAGDIERGPRGAGGWWGWSQSKEILEWLFWSGQVTTAERRHFQRRYALTERVVPAEILNAPLLSTDEAHRQLLTIAARALGIATARDLRDYFRLPADSIPQRLTELLERGVLRQVTVADWKLPAFMYADATLPQRVEAAALLSPFDSLIWERQRTERLFDFHLRLEIYTPAHKRIHGYYVLPFLLGDRLVARVDLKAERERQRLEVKGASLEAHARAEQVAEPLARQLAAMARWLGLDEVRVTTRRGELARALRSVTKAGSL